MYGADIREPTEQVKMKKKYVEEAQTHALHILTLLHMWVQPELNPTEPKHAT
jgi:hypothetical protein